MGWIVSINFLLYFVTLFSYIRKKRNIDVYVILLSAYTLTSLLCAIYFVSGQKDYTQVSIIGFIYLFICVLLLLSPFRNFKLNIGNISTNVNNPIIKTLVYIYIVTGLVSIYYTLPDTIDLYRSGEWGLLRQALYEDEESVVLYHSAFERLAKNLHSYLNPLGVVMCFYYLSKWETNKFLTVILFVSWLFNAFLGATLVASRGLIVTLLLQFIMLFFLFKDSISKGVKKLLSVTMIILSIPVVLYMIAVSVSRFGEDDAGNSVFAYLGHSMLNFNQNVLGTMHDYAGGRYFFSYFISLFGGNPEIDLQALGYKGSTGFYTIVGDYYLDFGPIGTIIIFLLFTLLLRSLMQKKHLRLSNLILIMYFAFYYMRGVFVLGLGTALGMLMCLVVFFVVRIAEAKNPI